MSPTCEASHSAEGHTNVDYLLERLTIAEIIDIQNKLRTDVDRKRHELKQLVGYESLNHYHTLIRLLLARGIGI